MKRVPQKWRERLIGVGVGLLIGLVLWGPEMFEPTDEPEFVHVQVVAYHTGGRGSQWFTVVAESGQSWQVGAARGPFTYTYRGPALLDVRRGRWTGKPHLRLLEDPAATNTPNHAMERTSTRRAFALRVATTLSLRSTLALGGRRSSLSR